MSGRHYRTYCGNSRRAVRTAPVLSIAGVTSLFLVLALWGCADEPSVGGRPDATVAEDAITDTSRDGADSDQQGADATIDAPFLVDTGPPRGGVEFAWLPRRPATPAMPSRGRRDTAETCNPGAASDCPVNAFCGTPVDVSCPDQRYEGPLCETAVSSVVQLDFELLPTYEHVAPVEIGLELWLAGEPWPDVESSPGRLEIQRADGLTAPEWVPLPSSADDAQLTLRLHPGSYEITLSLPGDGAVFPPVRRHASLTVHPSFTDTISDRAIIDVRVEMVTVSLSIDSVRIEALGAGEAITVYLGSAEGQLLVAEFLPGDPGSREVRLHPGSFEVEASVVSSGDRLGPGLFVLEALLVSESAELTVNLTSQAIEGSLDFIGLDDLDILGGRLLFENETARVEIALDDTDPVQVSRRAQPGVYTVSYTPSAQMVRAGVASGSTVILDGYWTDIPLDERLVFSTTRGLVEIDGVTPPESSGDRRGQIAFYSSAGHAATLDVAATGEAAFEGRLLDVTYTDVATSGELVAARLANGFRVSSRDERFNIETGVLSYSVTLGGLDIPDSEAPAEGARGTLRFEGVGGVSPRTVNVQSPATGPWTGDLTLARGSWDVSLHDAEAVIPPGSAALGRIVVGEDGAAVFDVGIVSVSGEVSQGTAALEGTEVVFTSAAGAVHRALASSSPLGYTYSVDVLPDLFQIQLQCHGSCPQAAELTYKNVLVGVNSYFCDIERDGP